MLTELKKKKFKMQFSEVARCCRVNAGYGGGRGWEKRQLCSETTHAPFLGPSLPRDISSLFAMSLFPWSTFVFILDLTFTVFPVCHKGPPKGHGLPLGSLCYGLKPCLCAGEVLQCRSAVTQGRWGLWRTNRSPGLALCPTYLQHFLAQQCDPGRG